MAAAGLPLRLEQFAVKTDKLLQPCTYGTKHCESVLELLLLCYFRTTLSDSIITQLYGTVKGFSGELLLQQI